MTPRWTYTEANATRWRHLFDDLLGGTTALEVPLEGNGKSLCSLRIRISDALKWLADQFRAGEPPWSLTPSDCTSTGPTPTTPSRTLTRRSAPA